MVRVALLGLALALVGCGTDYGDAGFDDPFSTQVPPRGHADLTAWLADRAYATWACEPAPHAERPPGVHGETRICNNAALVATASGPYPVGAAAVKEIYRGGTLAGHAVTRKLTQGETGRSWYWYEALDDGIGVDGYSETCVGCHTAAPRDFVWTRVP